jgi:arsenate reductase
VTRPTVLFVCVHNAGRSQMAAGYLQHLAGDRIEVLSAGSQPADSVNPVAVRAMAEQGIDLAREAPKVLTDSAVRRADVVVTMGCGDECPYVPGKRYEDWVLDDPAGQDIDMVRRVRDEIRRRVEALVEELDPRCTSGGRGYMIGTSALDPGGRMTPEEPLNDDDMTTGAAGGTVEPGGDADGTDGDATETTDGDTTDSDGTDSDGTDSDGTDGDATDTTDGDGSDSDGTDGDASDGDGTDGDGTDGDAS